MKTRLVILIIFVIILAFPGAIQAQETDPVAVITARIEALNAGDAEAAAAFFAPDAVYKINDPPPGARTLYSGREEIHGRLSELVAVNVNMQLEIRSVDGDNVTVLTRLVDDPLTEMGVDFIEGIEQYTVQDGKITSYEWTLTEASGAKIAAAMSAPEALPESGGRIFPTYPLVFLALGALVLVAGLALSLRPYRWVR